MMPRNIVNADKHRNTADGLTRGLRLWLAACLAACLMWGCAFACAETARAGNLGEDVQRLYTAASGLPSTAATAVAQTQDGFIWIGGYGGLVRYDGRDFAPCMEGELGSVQALLADSQGRLWIAARDLGLICCEKDQYTVLANLEDNAVASVGVLAEGDDGKIWFGTESGVGYVDGDMRQILPAIPKLRGKYITDLLPVERGILCVTRDGELYQVEGEAVQRVDLGSYTRQIRSIARDDARGGYLAGTTEERFLVLDEDLGLLQTVLTPGLECINDLLVDQDGMMWLCSDSGVGSYDGERVRIQSLDLDNSIDHMMIDREGSFWFVSSRQGVLEVCACRFGNVSRSAGLDNMVVNAVAARDGRLYIGHDNGLMILDAATYHRIDDLAFSGLWGIRIRSILSDGAGGLWFFTRGKGALHYDAENACQVYTSGSYPEIASNSFRCGILDGSVVLAGTDVGAYCIDGDSVSSIVEPANALPYRVLSIGGDQDHCWLGTDGYGLYEVREGRIVKHLLSEDGLGSNVVMKIVPGQARKGWWLVLGNGLAWMDAEGTVRRIHMGASGNILDIVILPDGQVWLPAGNGIFCATEEGLLSQDGVRARLYRGSDGIPYEITANSNQCVDGDMLYFSCTGGVVSLDLTNEAREVGSYSLILDHVMLDGQPVYVQDADRCTIPPEAHRIDFDVHLLTYQTEKPEVYYWLEGFDAAPTVTNMASMGDITYTNLGAGNYVFHFGVMDPNGAAMERELTLALEKQPRWYEQLWVWVEAAALATALLAVLIWFLLKRRMKKQERALRRRLEAEERDRLRQIAYRDYLTGLYNRNYLTEWKANVFPQIEWPLYFVAIDLNDLKKVNDTYGHAEGDELLKALSALLQQDFGRDGALFRTGGDEFLLLIGGLSREALDERLKQLHEKADQVKVRDVTLSFCEGIFEMNRHNSGFDDGMTRADMDLLRKKDMFHGRR